MVMVTHVLCHVITVTRSAVNHLTVLSGHQTCRDDISIILLLFCGTVCRLVYITLLITSLLHLHALNCLVSHLSTSPSLKKLKSIYYTVLFLSLYPNIGYLRADICGIDLQASLFHLIAYSFSYHSP